MNDSKLTPPTQPGQWTITQIEYALSRPLPKELLSTRKQGNKEIIYIPWYEANRILSKYAPGWHWSIDSIHSTDSKLFLHGTLTIPTSEGIVARSATGTEDLNCGSYGDPSSNAESMAFRRAAARFGLGSYLYDKD
ncbi:DUF1071 domain-containing protein [Leptolyngbya sp. NK1-12]|uniref:DUF1071 domain-containing protein n=1 Tax=Leptolyngbya sp. NK1-12 TaxID=2547451 RepID=A0AA96WCT6_9CYAN|nr:DUF1071 domain-containing protein [Leptolyngbya sp. NK1-12]WNZ22723.1 DUF1071 domain-containing protein [Leptolyngbya sp. NK1-12]